MATCTLTNLTPGSYTFSASFDGDDVNKPATASEVRYIVNSSTVKLSTISGVTAPTRDAVPVSNITETIQYTGTVSWNPNHSTFAADTEYRATITLTPKTGYTLQGVEENFFTVAGATSVTNAANNGKIIAVFPKTDKVPVNINDIVGITAPVRGEAAATAVDETDQYTGVVKWLPELTPEGRFAANTQYTATITLEPKSFYTLQGVPKDFFTVAGADSVTNNKDSGVITAVFPKTAPIPHSHSYGDWKSDGTDHWRQCSCGSISDKASHDFSKWTVDQRPDEGGKVSSSRKCTVCGYKQTEKNVPQTLTDSDAGVTVKGDFTSGAAISVKEAVLHEEGACKVCDEIRARQKAGELIVLYDISLTSGINSGEMEIAIPVDEKYNGQTVILLHCMDKEEERLEVKVENGLVKFTTKSLSPFAVLDTKKAESIKLDSSSMTLEIGNSRQLVYTVTPENIHSDKVTWTTSDKKVATVSPSGKVQAMKAGTATITCTAADGGSAKATCKVTVKNTATPLLNLRGTAGKNSIRLNWNQVSNADGYEIYGSRCGSRYSYGKVKTITKGSTKTWTQKGLRSGTAYKYYIKAYKLVNGKKLYLKTSLTSHVATTGSRYTNTKTVTTTFTDITLAKGKARQISSRITPVKKGGKLANHVPEFRYKTTNSKVATVNASGKITAAGKGKCSVYVYANNGVTRRILITVK